MKAQTFTALATLLALACLASSAVAAAPAAAARKARAAPATVINAAPTTIVAAAQPADPEPVKPEDPPAPAPATAPAPAPSPPVVRGEGAEALAFEPPSAATTAEPGLVVRPYFLIAGGLKYDIADGRPGETKQNRVSTFALGRLGAKAAWSDLVTAESEFMASGGTSLHGASAYEGQAAMQVRQQVVRLHRGVWRVEAGRLIDEGSVDYFSAHVAETFLQDTATRDPLLFDGFNLGYGCV
jgi:type IV secretory pathway VirB10-like protein